MTPTDVCPHGVSYTDLCEPCSHSRVEEWVGYPIYACGRCGVPWPCDFTEGADPMSAEKLEPGTKVRHNPSGYIVTLNRRKTPDESCYPGWWLREGGGLADYVIDGPKSGWTTITTNGEPLDPWAASAEAESLAARLSAFADELVDPLICRTPAYGAPGHPHCAACCYGTGVVVTCVEEQAIYDAAKALNHAAEVLRSGQAPITPIPIKRTRK